MDRRHDILANFMISKSYLAICVNHLKLGYIPITPALVRLKQENGEFSLGYNPVSK
jgi:hypothetical protein